MNEHTYYITRRTIRIVPLLITAMLLLASCQGAGTAGAGNASGNSPSPDGVINVSEATASPEAEQSTEPETEDPLAHLIGTAMWVRTPVTVYANDQDAQIAGFLKKGTQVQITGHNAALPDGSANMLQISADGTTGWVYAKYLADTEDAALAQYDKVYSIHEGREFSYELYGGTTDHLDWYPVKKEEFAGNPRIDDARTMYFCSDVLSSLDAYLELAHDCGVNSIVLDIKDYRPICDFDIMREMSPTSYDYYMFDRNFVRECTKQIMDEGFYLILRIVTFNDELYGEDHPEECIDSPESYVLWPSPYNRNIWYYNVALAEEAIELFHPNEIQFDYVRFPEEAFFMSDAGNTDFKNDYDEDKAEAIQNFLFYACDRVHSHGVYVSADVFAECSGDYITAYGQYFPAISNIVDVISAMPYTDHFGRSVDTWSDPYDLLYNWAQNAVLRQSEIETPAQVRTWLTGYSVPFWDPYISCNASYVMREASAIYNAGLKDGFLLWNGASSYSTYANIGYAWSYDYLSDVPEYFTPAVPEASDSDVSNVSDSSDISDDSDNQDISYYSDTSDYSDSEGDSDHPDSSDSVGDSDYSDTPDSDDSDYPDTPDSDGNSDYSNLDGDSDSEDNAND